MGATVATVEVVIPVLNEEHSLPSCVESLTTFLGNNLEQHACKITIADNGSTDGTLDVAKRLSADDSSHVGYTHLDVRGRGLALRKAWLESEADVVSYMDVDLSTELAAFPVLVDSIVRDGYHVAFGSRLARGANTRRSFKREFISRSYNTIIRLGMRTRFHDAQCGFKAVSREAARVLVPAVVNNHWFFDTELLVIADRRGFRMKEIPVEWYEDPDTRVKTAQTSIEMLKGLARLRFGGIPKVDPPGGK
jgi:glycosyltransferase involved in cell wall biosynthesis